MLPRKPDHIRTLETVERVARRLQPTARVPTLTAPPYTRGAEAPGVRLALAVASMRHHTTDEGWQLMYGLGLNGYELCGHGLTIPETHVPNLMRNHAPGVLVVQDKREWDGLTSGPGFDDRERFTGVDCLATRHDVFKVTVLKDAHQKPTYHAHSAAEMGAHAWITYYATPIVKKVAPYVREEHLIRTYHTVDPKAVPPFSQENRTGSIISGAVSNAYPLRQLIIRHASTIKGLRVLRHPGYGRDRCHTGEYLQTLSRHRVAICTASTYGYALRKIIEATACGCVVVTNLPTDDALPYIDENLVRIPSNASIDQVNRAVTHATERYNADRQQHFAELACHRYDYRRETERLAVSIETLRRSYSQ